MHSCGSHYRPRSPQDSLNAAPRIYAAGGCNKICTSPREEYRRPCTCMSHAESSLREHEFRGVQRLLPRRRRTASIRTPPVTKSWFEEKIGPIGSSLEAEFPERRKSKRPRATSTVREVLWRITGMHSDDKNDKDKLKYESVFHYCRVTAFSIPL